MVTEYNIDGAKAKATWESIAASWVRYCEEHDVYACVEGNSVVLTIHWTKRELDGSITCGCDYKRCSTLKQIKALLGY